MAQPESASEKTLQLDHPALGELEYLEDLDSQSLAIVQKCTYEIKSLSKRTGIDTVRIGENVLNVKEQLKHGQFGKWLNSEFGWSPKMAYRFCNVFNCFSCVNLTEIDIALSALYELSEPAVPEAARQEALEIGVQGERITVRKAKTIVQRHKSPPATAVSSEVLPPERSIVNVQKQPVTTITIQEETHGIAQQKLLSPENSHKSTLILNDGGPRQFPQCEVQRIDCDESILKQNPLQEIIVSAPGLRVSFVSRSGDLVSWFQQQSSVLAKRLAS